MATIDLTVERGRDTAGIRRRVTGRYTGPASYATGGEALSAEELSLGDLEFIIFEPPINATPACRLITYDHTNNKAIWFDMAGAEIANGVDLSGFSARFEGFGR